MALGLILLVIVAALILRGRGTEDDRLTDNQVTASREDPEQRCAGQATYDRIKRELFRRAAAVRGSDQAAFDKLAGYAAVRMEAPVVRDEDEKVGSVTCSGTLSLDLPPGVAVVGGRRTLTAEIGYTVQPAADGSGDVVTLTDADPIITPLATLARVGGASTAAEPGTETGNVIEPPVAPDAPAAPSTDQPPAAPAPPSAPSTTVGASPSFDCDDARTRGEIAVCRNPALAALDRQMAAQFQSAFSDGDQEQRRVLIWTRSRFLRYRDQCPSDACIAETYRGRMREIRDIVTGRWQPQR
jgi:uncharacterized protein YecT (DUF1311 family)